MDRRKQPVHVPWSRSRACYRVPEKWFDTPPVLESSKLQHHVEERNGACQDGAPVENLSAARGTDTGKVSTCSSTGDLASKVGDHIRAVEKEHLFPLLVSMRTCFHLAAPILA